MTKPIFNQKIRISKKLLASLPPIVADAIKTIQSDHDSIKSMNVSIYQDWYELYCDEGDQYTCIYGDEVKSLEMVSAHTIGASNVRYEIGAIIPLPVGTVLLTVWYLGKYHLQLTNIVPSSASVNPQIGAANLLPAFIS